jgi:uncharacterized protein (TIGR03067 family)
MGTKIACVLGVLLLSLAADAPEDARSKKDLAALEGTWTLVSVEAEGKSRDFPENPPWVVIKGNKVQYAGEDLAVLTVDATVTPKSIDMAFSNPKTVYEGIYSLEGDTLKVCVNRVTEGVKERPTGFATEDKPDLRLFVLKREKAAKASPTDGLPGFVGIAIKFDEERKEVVIMDTIDDSPAKKAGLKKDDVVLKVGDQDATDLQGTVAAVRRAKPGSELTFRIKRDGKEQDIKVKVGVMPFNLLG